MVGKRNSSTTYEKLREAFAAVNPTSGDERLRLISAIFSGDDFWANRSEDHFIEYQYEDPLKPFKRFVEQKPAILSTTFAMSKADLKDRELMQYTEHMLTRSRSHLLTVSYAAAWFFLRNFGLLLRCRHGSSKEKVLDLYHAPETGQNRTFSSIPPLFDSSCREDFAETPIVFCGELRPSDLLNRGQNFRCVVTFPYYCMEWSADRESCSVTAYMLEFPEPIEPVITKAELFELPNS